MSQNNKNGIREKRRKKEKTLIPIIKEKNVDKSDKKEVKQKIKQKIYLIQKKIL